MRRLFLPLLILAAALIADRFDLLRSLDAGLLRQGAWVVFGVSSLLAARFRRGRVVYAVLMFLALVELPMSPVMQMAAAILLPLNLAVLAWLADWRVLSTAGLVRLVVLGAQIGLVALLGSALPADANPVDANALSPSGEEAWAMNATADLGTDLARKTQEILHWSPFPQESLPDFQQTALLAFLIAALVIALRFLRPSTALEGGFAGALVAAGAATFSQQPLLYLAVAGLILGLTMVDGAFSLAFEDGLTGLPARRALEETLVHLGRTYAIAMLDLDHFKKFNDTHGHEIGDQVLQMVAAKLAKVQGGGEAFRYGGEEFTVVFQGKTAKEAKPFLDDLRETIADADFVVRSPGRPKKKPAAKKSTAKGKSKAKPKNPPGTKSLKVTVSIGVSERSDKNRLPEEVMKAADKALYRSKKAGRNRVTIGK